MRIASLLTLLILLTFSQSFAVVRSWTGTTSTSWNDPNNWMPVGVPTVADDVQILGPYANEPVVDITTAICRDLTIQFSDMEVSIGMQLDIARHLVFSNTSNLYVRPNARLRLQGNLNNSSGNGNLSCDAGSRLILYGSINTMISGALDNIYDVTINKVPPFIVFNESGTYININNHLTIDRGVLRLCDSDLNGPTPAFLNNYSTSAIPPALDHTYAGLPAGVQNPDLRVKGNVVINNGGGLDLSGKHDIDMGYIADADGHNSERLVVELWGNLSDNSPPFDPDYNRGFFIGTLSIGNTTHVGERALIVFRGDRDQTVLGQYTLRDGGNVPNQGSGMWLPRVLIFKSNSAKRVAMLNGLRIFGNSEIRNGVLLINGKRLLFGETNGEELHVTSAGTLYANENSEIRMFTTTADGTFLRAYSGGYLKFIGAADQRVTFTRDAGVTGVYYRTAAYTGAQVAMQHVDFNFQGTSNTGFAVTQLGVPTCNCTTVAANPCYESQGGLKIFSGVTIDPEGLGANMSDICYSGIANGGTNLTFNVAGTYTMSNVIFNASNQAQAFPWVFVGPPTAGCAVAYPLLSGSACLCRTGSSSPSSAISNNAATTLVFDRGSGLSGGEVIGEGWDAGTRDYNTPDGSARPVHQNTGIVSYPNPGANDFIVHIGYKVAIWIGRGNNNNWSNIDNWSTKELTGSPVPGVGGADTFVVVIPNGAMRTPVVDVDVTLSGGMYINLVGYPIPATYLSAANPLYTAGSAYTQGSGTPANESVTVNAARTLNVRKDVLNYDNGTLTMTGTSFLRVGGNFFNFGAATFVPNTSTVTLDGNTVQQVRTGYGAGIDYGATPTQDIFYNLVVNKPTSSVQIQMNSLVVLNDFTHTDGELELFSGQDLRVNGDFVMNAGNHIWNFSILRFGKNYIVNGGTVMPQGSAVRLQSAVAGTYRFKTNDQPFNYLYFNGTATTIYQLEDDLIILSSHKEKVEVDPGIADVENRSSIAAGTELQLRGNSMRVQHFLVDGTLTVNSGTGPKGGELLITGLDDAITTGTPSYTGYPSAGVLKDNSIRFRTGARFNVIGTAGKTSKVSRYGTSGYYKLQMETGSTISAEYALFELVDVDGIDCRTATIAHPNAGYGCFSYCTFTNGDPTAGGILLRLPNTWPGVAAQLTILEIGFPTQASATAVNVWRTGGAGGSNLIFSNFSGIFADEDYDFDNGKGDAWTTWNAGTVKRWDRGAGTDNWHDANNWCPNGVPTATDNVILDHTNCSIAPTYTINVNAAAAVKDLYILPDFNNAVANPIVLNVNANFTVNGDFTNGVAGTFNIQNTTSTITFKRSFSSRGEFYHGQNPNLTFDGTGINVIANTRFDDYPFWNVNFINGFYELNSIIDIANNLVIETNGYLDASNDNYRINLGGDWTNNQGTFEPRFGTVAFVDFDPHTETLGAGTINYPAVSNAQDLTYDNGYATFADSLANLSLVPENYFNLIIEKHLSPAGQNVKTYGSILVDGVLDLRQRNLNTQCNTCATPGVDDRNYENLAIIGLFGSWTNASDVSYVDGPLARTYISNVPFNYDYPIGKFAEYVKPMELELSMATNGPELAIFAVEQFNEQIDTLDRSVPAPCTPPDPGRTLVVLPRYWNIAQVNPNLWGTPVMAIGNIKLVWDNNDGITASYQNIRAVKDDGPNQRGLAAPYNPFDLKAYEVGCPPNTATINGNNLGGEIVTTGNFGALGDGDFGLVYYDQILPIDNILFSARYNQPNAQLNWTTENEINNAGFILLRAENNTNVFQPLASYVTNDRLKGKGTYQGSSDYVFFDPQVIPGRTYYYQLLTQDNDGKLHFAGQREVTVPLDNYLGMPYPNPFGSQLTVPFALATDQAMTMEIITLQGQKIRTLLDNTYVPAGGHQLLVDTQGLSRGVYILRMQTDREVRTVRIVKQD